MRKVYYSKQDKSPTRRLTIFPVIGVVFNASLWVSKAAFWFYELHFRLGNKQN